ncbi:MAG: hypothetical protein HXX81_03935, partial [Campylobacterales bacterium]|nr:hypothetical protein [Campylobacterales bacterium]
MQSIKSILVKRFLLIFTILTILIISALIIGFREVAIKNAEDKALAIAGIIKAGLTAHMKNNIMDKRDYFLNEIQS